MNLAAQLEQEEGRVRHAYPDSLGFWTIGVGRMIDVRKGGGLSDAEIDMLLANDITAKTDDVMRALPWAAALDEPRRAVLVGMAFQMGTLGLLGFMDMLAKVKRGDYDSAALAMLDSRWARQTPERAKRMARQMATGEWVMKG